MDDDPVFTGDLVEDMETAKRLIGRHLHVDLATLMTIAADRTRPESARIAAVYTLGFCDGHGVSAQVLKAIVDAAGPGALRAHAVEALASVTGRLCSICKRPLDCEDDPLSENCGGDCLACIIAAEDGTPAPDLPPDKLRAWLETRDERMRALWEEATRWAT